MNEDFDAVALRVRTDTSGFARDVGDMRAILSEGLAGGADAAGRGIETALRRAARNGRLEFEDLARVAGRALGEIAAAALKVEFGTGPGGAGSVVSSAVAGLLGLPGRATGGPVAPGRAYVVGERGPELFVPTSSGRVEARDAARGPVNVTVNISAPREAGRDFMAQTGRQVAREVRRALERAGS
ncbi:MAG: tail tape measure protein [Sandarakinorhabdus sp.]|nr:tail tape measure protein [Sandarakinorhabdus sp.]